MSPQLVGKTKLFDGWLNTYTHDSETCNCSMRFSVYLPPQAERGPVPAVYWLSGLTCTDENFMVKAGAQRYAADLGIALIAPDTSPRGEGVPDDPEYDHGQGAGFYVNATQAPWSRHYHMYDYVTGELPALVEKHVPVVPGLKSVTGHSMGGHGALIVALRNPDSYRAVSAFAPIGAPMRSPWGRKAFSGYLGNTPSDWEAYDASVLVSRAKRKIPLFIDQGDADEFLDEQLKPDLFKEACAASDYPLNLRIQPGYDHSYYFISTFIGEHLRYHAEALAQ